MNEQNLVSLADRTTAEQRTIARMGGVASGRVRLRRKHGRELLLTLLSMKELDPKVAAELSTTFGIPADQLTKEVAMHSRQVDKAIRKGDTNAYNAVCKAAGLAEPEPLAPSQTIGLQINVGSPEAADGLRHAIATGAQPAPPEQED